MHDYYFVLPADKIIASHVINLRHRDSLHMLQLEDKQIWNVRNGVLVIQAIETAYENLEIVRTHC